MKYVIDGESYQVEIIKKNNKNSYIRFKDDKIIVTTNYLASKKYVLDLISKNHDAISVMINKGNIKKEKNEQFYYLGNKYDKIYVTGLDEIFFSEENIYIKDDKQLDKWLDKEVKKLFTTYLNKVYDLFKEDIIFPKLKIRNMKTRWGVCNRKNLSVTLNYSLIRYDLKCLEYVIVHELSHLIHFDHSKNFWNLVSKYCPDYKKIKSILND